MKMELKSLILIIVLVAVSQAKFAEIITQTYREEVQELAKKVNQDKSLNWQADENLEFLEGVTREQFRARNGGKFRYNGEKHSIQELEAQGIKIYQESEVDSNGNNDDSDIPEEFDSRVQWPNCESIKEIRNQANCGSCWAFGACEAFSDRWCVASGQKQQVRMSTENLISCCEFCGNGCGGGYNPMTWIYFQYTGICSGDLYGDNQWCQPYSLPPPDKPQPHLYSNGADPETPKCRYECNSDFKGGSYKNDLYFTSSSGMIIDFNLRAVQREIMTNGPVETMFFVYSDFSAYTGGVYKKSKDAVNEGGHSVKIIGWGVENGEKYWLVANSWGPDWGDKGFFKILRGVNECEIEHEISYGQPDLSKNNHQN